LLHMFSDTREEHRHCQMTDPHGMTLPVRTAVSSLFQQFSAVAQSIDRNWM